MGAAQSDFLTFTLTALSSIWDLVTTFWGILLILNGVDLIPMNKTPTFLNHGSPKHMI